MAYLYRLVVLLLALAASSAAYAVVCTQYYGYFSGGAGDWTTTKALGAQGAVDDANAKRPACSSTTNVGGVPYSTCPHYKLYGTAGESSFTVINETDACVASGGYPACGTSYSGAYGTRSGDYCSPPPNYCLGLAGMAPTGLTCTGDSCRFYTPDSTKRTACQAQEAGQSGCAVTGSLDVAWYDTQQALWGVKITGVTYTGAECTVGTTMPGTGTVTSSVTGTTTVPTLDATKDGKCPGTVNGVEVWVTCGTVTPGSTTPTTDTTSVTNPDGSVTTTSKTTGNTTTCTNGVCTTTSSTTTTITVTPSGGGAGSSTTTVSGGTATGTLSGFCEQAGNKSLSICDGEGGFGGTCDTGFQCTGDAVLCATAKATNEQKCLLSKESPEATLYESVKANTTTTGLGTETTAISSASFNQGNALGVSSCVLDKTITISMSTFTKTVVLPFSVLCPYLEQLGSLLVALSMLAAMFIVFRR